MRQMRLHTEAFEHRCLYTKKTLHRDTLTYTRLYTRTQKLLHRFFQRITEEALTQRSLYTEPLLHTEAFTHRKFPQKFLHREAFTHRSFYTQTPLHTEACTHGGFFTQKLLHREAFTQSSFYTLQNRKFTLFFDVRPSCRAKGLQLAFENYNS